MRHTLRALLSALVVVGCCQLGAAEESRWRWWPFGNEGDPLTAATPTTVPPTLPPAATSTATATTTVPAHVPTLPPSPDITPVGPETVPPIAGTAQARAAQRPSVSGQSVPAPAAETSIPKFTWPKVAMPQVSLPKPQMPQLWPSRKEVNQTRNTWVEQNPPTEKPSPLQAMRDGVHRVGDSTRTAWHKTIDTLTPGDRVQHPSGQQFAQREIKPPFWKRMFGAEEPQPQGPQTIPQWMAQDRLDP